MLRGSVVGIAAGTFAFLALILVMHGIAWLLNEELFEDKFWPGFFVEAALFLLIAAVAGLVRLPRRPGRARRRCPSRRSRRRSETQGERPYAEQREHGAAPSTWRSR